MAQRQELAIDGTTKEESSSAPPSRLLALPAELRLQIYTEILAAFRPPKINITHVLSLPPHISPAVRCILLKTARVTRPSLLNVSATIRDEALRLYRARLVELAKDNLNQYIATLEKAGEALQTRADLPGSLFAWRESHDRKRLAKEERETFERFMRAEDTAFRLCFPMK